MIIPILFLIVISVFNKRLRPKPSEYKQPRFLFSLLTPAHNEEPVIGRTIRKFLATDYPSNKKEMIIVNDGSTDNMEKIARIYAYKIINSETSKVEYNPRGLKNIILVNRKKGGMGKAFAVNDGLQYAGGNLVMLIDADVQLSKDIFRQAATHFKNKETWAVAGNINVAEKKGKMLNQFVDFECVVAQKLMRKGFDTLGIHYIIPGGCGIFRREALDYLGPFSSDTLAEDTDYTWKLITETHKKIRFDADINVTADEPTTLLGLWNQRVRWARGNFAVSLKYKNRVGRSRFGKAATIGIPFWYANMFVPVTFLFTTLGLLLSMMLSTNVGMLSTSGRIFGFSFIVIWLMGVYINKGRSWFAGLISPGIPILLTLVASIIYSGGLSTMLAQLGLGTYATAISFFIFIWIMLAMPLTYLLVHSNLEEGIAEFIQIYFIGYWMLLICPALNGYIKELRKEKPVWIRTVR